MNNTKVKAHRRVERSGKVVPVQEYRRKSKLDAAPIFAGLAIGGSALGLGGMYLLNKRIGNKAGAQNLVNPNRLIKAAAGTTPTYTTDGIIRFLDKNGREAAMDGSLIVGSMSGTAKRASGQSEAFLNKLYDDVLNNPYAATPLNQRAVGQLDIIATGAKARTRYASMRGNYGNSQARLDTSPELAKALRTDFVRQRQKALTALAGNRGAVPDREFLRDVDANYRDKLPILYANRDMVLGGPHGKLLYNPSQTLQKLAKETDKTLEDLTQRAIGRTKGSGHGLTSATQGRQAMDDLEFLAYSEKALKDVRMSEFDREELQKQLRSYKYLHQVNDSNYNEYKRSLQKRAEAYRAIQKNIVDYVQGRSNTAAAYFTPKDKYPLTQLTELYGIRQLLSQRNRLLAEYQRDPRYARYLLDSGRYIDPAAYAQTARARFYGVSPEQLRQTRQQPLASLRKDDLGRTQLDSPRFGIRTTFSSPRLTELSYT